MRASVLRKEVLQYVDHADERFLRMVYAMSKEYENSLVVGQSANGEPLTKAEIKKRVKAASKRVKSGDFIAHEEVEVN
ncbi:MAG TPA: hypothetical protein VK205_03800 [Prolixibacteraceae bacterium]|nr:hypothetical protein [Prolixibacteraceae bacterium]